VFELKEKRIIGNFNFGKKKKIEKDREKRG